MLQVVILAAGLGKRMRSALPKVLQPLAGRPMLAHVIDAARALQPDSVCVVVGHGADHVKAAFAGRSLQFAVQSPQLGTGHAVMQALPQLKPVGTVIVLYGDVPLITSATLSRLVAACGGEKLALLTEVLDDPAGYGRIIRDRNGAITGIVEEKDATPEQRAVKEINTGIMAIPGKVLGGWLSRLSNRNAQAEYYLTDIVALAVQDAVPVTAAQPGGVFECQGVNAKAELAQLERKYQMNWAETLLEQGVTLADSARIDVRGTLTCGRDVSIDVNCIFEGAVELADGVSIGANCILRNVKIGANTQILPFSYMEDSSIGAGARIGPFSRLRPGNTLADEVHVGNFVEIKASQLGERSKANHLSYVGDSVVGRDVNIGAGTITCNYDGANKHKTVIEDNVHIGSDVQLVAPVTVCKNATVGAGTTVWRDVPPGTLAINSKEQVAKTGWVRPTKAKT